MKTLHVLIMATLCLGTNMLQADSSLQNEEKDFDQMMGKDTEHWKYLTKNDEMEFFHRCKDLYTKNIALKEIPTEENKVPNVVHFIWLGPRAFPPESVENVRTWIAMHPDWKFVFWTDRARPAPCHGMEVREVKDFTFTKLYSCFAQSENWGEKSDILRYEILYQEGGIYVDHDANCLKSFEDLNSHYDFYCGFETPHTPFVGKNLTCGNGVLGSKPHHPTIEKVIGLILQRWEGLSKRFRGKDAFSKDELVMQRTYIALTDALQDTLEHEGNRDIVFPAAYFFAKTGLHSLYSKHFFANAWADDNISKSEFEKTLPSQMSKLNQRSKHMLLGFFGLFGLSLLSVIMLFVIYMKVKARYFSSK